MAIAAGTLLGRYKIRSLLGAGGMGEVYLAEDTQLGRTVALKVLPAEVASDQKRMGRFRQEARAASTLNHPNVAHIYEIGEAEGVQFIAMEFVDGLTLRHEMAHLRTKMHEALEVALQVTSALVAAHAAGIVHRDIKPENIMVRPDGYVKVLDFGLAKLTEARANDSGASTLINTDPGVIIGTVHYMSPEQARGREVDARADIFSFGVVLYEMIAGRPPFEAETKSDVVAAILNDEPPPMARYSREVPETLEWIVNKALRKDREERYQTAKELLTDLRSLKRKLEFAAEQERSLPPIATARMSGSMPGQSVDTLVDDLVVEREARTEKLEAARSTATSVEHPARLSKDSRRVIALALAGLLFAGAALFFGLKYLRHDKSQSLRAQSFGKMKVTRLTTNGKANVAAISPDGKYVVHVMGASGQQSLKLRHIATGSDKEIVPSNGNDFTWMTFSPDGGYVYYTRIEAGSYPLFQVPVLGGTPKKLISEDVDTPVTFSPDGKRLAFLRGAPPYGVVWLIVANADGTGEQKLVTRKLSDFVGSIYAHPSWSPDGETIAFAHLNPDADARYANVFTVSVKDGTEKQITSQKWSGMRAVAWLADGSGLIIVAADEESGAAQQIWHVSYPGGEARRITNDTNNYRNISLTADSTALVTVQTERASNVWVASSGEAARAHQLTTNRSDGLIGVAWTPDGKIVYTSNEGGRTDIWIMNGDGTGQKQLTSDASNVSPSISPDGRYIVFSSARENRSNIWRIDIDGTHPKRLTDGSSDTNPSFSPDGQWVFYTALDADKQRLRKVPVDGGDSVPVTDYYTAGPLVSPDGKLISCGYVDVDEKPPRWRIAIISSAGGPPIKTFDISAFLSRYHWATDGRALLYTDTRDGVTNIWSQHIDGGAPKQITDFKSDQIFRFDRSRDGKQFVFARGNVTSDVVMITDLR
ncbi:MAG TPA: protein kinase [Pyrinomonadaceae bacterium]|jgi:serine/threonine protein kinase/Tol biopolymer transport system component